MNLAVHTMVRRFPMFLLALGCLLALPTTSSAEDERVLDVNAAEIEEMLDGIRPEDPSRYGLLALPEKAVEALSPEMREIRSALVAEQDRVAALRNRIETATAARDGAAVLALQREVEAARRAAEARIVEIQIRHARERGDDTTVKDLEAALERMSREGITGTPQERREPPR
jgi:hypothetical protein